jgi:hypothetical protein
MKTHSRSVIDGICLLAVALLAVCGVYSFTRVADAAPVPKSIKEHGYDCTNGGPCDCSYVTYYAVITKIVGAPPAVPFPDPGYEFVYEDGIKFTSTDNAISVLAGCATGSVSNIDNSLFTYKYLSGGIQRCNGANFGQGDIPNGQNEVKYHIFALNRDDAFGDPAAAAKNTCSN